MNLFQTLREKSGWKVLFWAFLGWLAANIVEWAGAIEMPEPWKGITVGFATFVAGSLRLLVAWRREPTINPAALPSHTAATLPLQARVEVARAKERDPARAAQADQDVGAL